MKTWARWAQQGTSGRYACCTLTRGGGNRRNPLFLHTRSAEHASPTIIFCLAQVLPRWATPRANVPVSAARGAKGLHAPLVLLPLATLLAKGRLAFDCFIVCVLRWWVTEPNLTTPILTIWCWYPTLIDIWWRTQPGPVRPLYSLKTFI